MTSLDKALDILEYVYSRNGRAVTPSEAAKQCQINASSSVRMIKALVARGYLEQLSRKGGYVAGPMPVSLGLRNNTYQRLATAASEPCRMLAQFTGTPVNLAVMNNNCRIMLCHYSPVPGWTPWERMSFADDHYATATGRLLLSTLDDRQLAACVKDIGMPGHLWPEADTLDKLKQELADIRRSGQVCFRLNIVEDMWIIGRLVESPGYPTSAFGFGIPAGNDPNPVIQQASITALNISAALSPAHKQCF